jgi:hypothetical protein
MDYCPRVPTALPTPPAGTPSGTGSPGAVYQNGQLGADYGPGQPLPPPATSPAPLRAGAGICTETSFYASDADCDDGRGLGSECLFCTKSDDHGETWLETRLEAASKRWSVTRQLPMCLPLYGRLPSGETLLDASDHRLLSQVVAMLAGHAHTVSSPSISLSDWPTDVLPAERTFEVCAGNIVAKGVGTLPFHVTLIPAPVLTASNKTNGRITFDGSGTTVDRCEVAYNTDDIFGSDLLVLFMGNSAFNTFATVQLGYICGTEMASLHDRSQPST